MTQFPHSICLVDPVLIWLTIACDFLIMLAYYALPIMLMALYAARPRSNRWQYSIHSWVLVLFTIFIFACGTTHLFEIVTMFKPWYWAALVVKGVTALASLGTAWALVRHKKPLMEFPFIVERDYQKIHELENRIALLVEQH